MCDEPAVLGRITLCDEPAVLGRITLCVEPVVLDRVYLFSSLGSNHLTAHLTAMKRLAPDPSISISDLMGPFETMFKEMGSWDLLSLVEPPKNGKVTWKSAADPSWLGQRHVSQLFQRLFKVARNGVLASSKVKLALVKLQHQKQRMNFSKLMDDDWQDKVDETLRICAKQYRELKKFPDLYGGSWSILCQSEAKGKLPKGKFGKGKFCWRAP